MRRTTKTTIGQVVGGTEVIIGVIVFLIFMSNKEKLQHFIGSISISTVLIIIGIIFLVNYSRPPARRWF